MKKVYITPKVKSEKVELGVFGSYGCSDNTHTPFRPFKWFYNGFNRRHR